MITIEMTVDMCLQDPAASDWFKRTLSEAMERDIVDAIAEAEVLIKLLHHKRINMIQAAEFRSGIKHHV